MTSIVAFDDYFCYAANALADFLRENRSFIFSPYCQFGWHGMSFIAEEKIHWKRINLSLLSNVGSSVAFC
jgi:hypothetical protein